MPPPQQVTDLLQAWSQGDQAALDSLFLLIYRELRSLAARHLRRERANHTLQPTALVHEVYLRLADWKDITWNDRLQFFAAASNVMRHILIDHARRYRAAKRGGGARRVVLDEAIGVPARQEIDLIALDEALTTLEDIDRPLSRIVELHYFGGLSIEETAQLQGCSVRTVARQWRAAKAWLHRELSKEDAYARRNLAAG
jgi:RNA polymerase sigma factor (TIGR02999 family)